MYNFSDYNNIKFGNLIVGYVDDVDENRVIVIKKYDLEKRDNVPTMDNLIDEFKDIINEDKKLIVLYETIKVSITINSIISNVENNLERYVYDFFNKNILYKLKDYHPELPIEHNNYFYFCAYTGKEYPQEDLVLLDKHIVHKEFVNYLGAIQCQLYQDENYHPEPIQDILGLVNKAYNINITEVYTTEPIYNCDGNIPKCIMSRDIVSMIRRNCNLIYDVETKTIDINYRLALRESELIVGDGRDYIKPYDYVPDEFIIRNLTTKENNTDIYTVGLEIEVECPNRNRKRISYELIKDYGQSERLFYIVHDGSLNNGLEVVTMPFKINRMTGAKNIIKELSPTLEYMNKKGNTFTANTCGLHIHIGRDGLNKHTLPKLQYMFDLWWEDLLKFSGRPRESRYSQQLNAMIYKNKKDKLNCIHPMLYGSRKEPSKYFCVNTLHTKTIEIRLWQGTQDKEQIEAMIEMTLLLFNIAKHKTINEIYNIDFKDLWRMSANKTFKKIFKERILNS